MTDIVLIMDTRQMLWNLSDDGYLPDERYPTDDGYLADMDI